MNRRQCARTRVHRRRRAPDAKRPLRYKRADRSQEGFNTLLIIKSDQSDVALPLQSVSTTTKRHVGVAQVRAGINRAGVKIARSMTRLILERPDFVGGDACKSDSDDPVDLLKVIDRRATRRKEID